MFAESGGLSPVGRASTLNTSPDTPARCRRCGSTEVVIRRCETGPHFARVRCPDCGWHGFLKTPWSLDRARAFTIPFGRFRGRTVGQLAQTSEGRQYLCWVADHVGGNPAVAARIVLDFGFQTSSDGPSLNKKAPSIVVRSTGTSGATPPLAEPRESP